MRFQPYVVVIMFLVFHVGCRREEPYLSRLSLDGYAGELGVSPNGSVWIATSGGKIYTTPQIGKLWHEDTVHQGITSASYCDFERINFFPDNTIMLSGFLDEDNKPISIYRSTDHGKSWTKVIFGNSKRMCAAYVGKNGKAWMTGDSQFIYYTEDSGKTWKTFDKIEKSGDLKLMSIFFKEDGKTGLFGASWDKLYLTKNNCTSWIPIVTPLSQNRYNRVKKTKHPEIVKVKIFGNHYIISQEGRTFITLANNIRWQYHPEIIDFEVTDDGKLYTINKDLSIALYDTAFSNIWKSTQKLDCEPSRIAVQDGKLFALTPLRLYKVSPDEFTSSDLLTNDHPIKEPHLKIQIGNEDYGFEGKDVLKYNVKRKQWFRYMLLDFKVANATLLNDKLLVADESLTIYYHLNLTQRSFTPISLPNQMFNLDVNPVIEFSFEHESKGCFHNNSVRKTFFRKGDQFLLNNDTQANLYLPKISKVIDVNTVNSLVRLIDGFKANKIAIADLKISSKDAEGFKHFIDKEAQRIKKYGLDEYNVDTKYPFPGENTDFSYYKKIADSLFFLPPDTINNVFMQPDRNWSTTTNWRRITFLFENGKKLTVENSDYQPNYLFMPWDVNYEGLKLKSNSIKFGEIIDDLTQGAFYWPEVREKNYAIFRIADYLYRQKIAK